MARQRSITPKYPRKGNLAVMTLTDFVGKRKDFCPGSAPGTTKRHRLEENIAAAAVELTVSDLCDIEAAASQIVIHGDRYSESAQRMINR